MDKAEVLKGQDLMSAFESYFELCFAFQLKYPAEVSALLHLIQTRFAKYGDPSAEHGRLTVLRKDPLMTRLGKFSVIIDPN